MKLTFIPSDFVDLNDPIVAYDGVERPSTMQYIDARDCPLARALIRAGVIAKGDAAPLVGSKQINEIMSQLRDGAQSVTIDFNYNGQ